MFVCIIDKVQIIRVQRVPYTTVLFTVSALELFFSDFFFSVLFNFNARVV